MATKQKFNIIAPLSVSIVVITLGAAFGVLSGRGAFIGMISTSLITSITALVGGSRYGVSTPTGPMTAAISVILLANQQWLTTHTSNLDITTLTNLTLLFSGLILLFLTLIQVHKLVKLVPNLVISGFVNGIALLIIITQLKSISSIADLILMGTTFFIATLISNLGSKSTHIGWKIITSSIFVISTMSLIAIILNAPVSYIDLTTNNQHFSLSIPNLKNINIETLFVIGPMAFELALIALLDTLLTALIMDKKTNHKTQLSRELTGQGISLLGVSLVGGIPGAQSTVPSMIMLQEKGHHQYSKIALALFCIAFTFLFADLIQYVPLAIFGGIIFKIAFDVADLTSIKSIFADNSKNKLCRIFITLGTCLSTVLLSLNLAVIGFTFMFILWNLISPKKLQIIDLKIPNQAEGLTDEL